MGFSRGSALAVLAAAVALIGLPELHAAPAGKAAKHARRSCPVQKPQKFLIRSSFISHGGLEPAAHARALRYRAERYGSVPGYGLEQYNAKTAYEQATVVHFFGLPVQVHQKIAPLLRCVERHIRRECSNRADRYTPRAVGGFRQHNTYRGGEISNHLFGIAIDIDPDRNPCCGCVSPWPDHPACKANADSVYERTALPKCWIDAFEHYGFYWLGRDPDLRDTMHFEFLGDPELIKP